LRLTELLGPVTRVKKKKKKKYLDGGAGGLLDAHVPEPVFQRHQQRHIAPDDCLFQSLGFRLYSPFALHAPIKWAIQGYVIKKRG